MPREQIGTLVVCQSCKKAVWAYDGNYGDLRGTLNCLKIPCRKCGSKGNYDGWAVTPEGLKAMDACDVWDAMRKWAARHGYEWDISPDCTWEIPYWLPKPAPR